MEDRKVKAGSMYETFLTTEYDLAAFEENGNYDFTPEGAHRTAEDGANWKQAKTASEHTIMLKDMIGVEPDDPKWDEFINEFTWDELMKFVEDNDQNSPKLDSIGKPTAQEGDGPQQFSIMAWVSSPIIAATFNPRLAHEQGECIGMESQIKGKAGWWGCAVNTHRSPFGGRNFEYYSADPFLMGRIAAQVVGAATDRGVFAYFKHFAVNDQEKNRESGISFVNEQALREIYLKSFQMVFEEGKSLGVMGSYNRLGLIETAASYPLMTEVLRGEWGFKGSVLSDMTHASNEHVNFKCYENVTWRIMAGCNCQLDMSGGFPGQVGKYATWDSNANDGKGAPVLTSGNKGIAWSLWNACREGVKQHMYMCVNSTLMQRGLTQVVGQTDATVKVGQDINYDVEELLANNEITVGETVDIYDSSNTKSSKEIVSIDSYELNTRCELPKGITFENGVLKGKFENVQLARIDIIINITLPEQQNGKIAYKFVINVEPGDDDTEEEKGCSMSIVAASALVSTLAIAGGSLLAIAKKRKED